MSLIDGFKWVLYCTGRAVRETGQAIDRLGCNIQGNLAYREQLSRHRRLMPLYDKKPTIGKYTFIAPSASIIGSTSIGNHSSVWYGAVLRGDVNSIKIGTCSSIGDRVTVHVSHTSLTGESKMLPTLIGDHVTISQGAVLHACTIEDQALVDIGSVVLDGSVVSYQSILGPGSLLLPGQRVPPGEYWSGNPAKFDRKLTHEEIANIITLAEKNYELARKHDKVHQRSGTEEQFEKDRIYNVDDKPAYVPENLF